jgi:hypothetical protein
VADTASIGERHKPRKPESSAPPDFLKEVLMTTIIIITFAASILVSVIFWSLGKAAKAIDHEAMLEMWEGQE